MLRNEASGVGVDADDPACDNPVVGGASGHASGSIEYTLIRSPRRRRTIGITIEDDGTVVVRAPNRASMAAIDDVVRHKATWIAKRQSEAARRPQPPRFVTGETILYLGRPLALHIAHAETRTPRVIFHGSALEVALPPQVSENEAQSIVKSAIESWYRERAAEVLQIAVEGWAREMGCKPGRVIIRNQKRQWGSCAPDGTLRFNWRLVMLEPSLIHYVVVHELTHLRVRNHSPKFWAAVAVVLPDATERRKRLRESGYTLTL